MTVEDTLTPEQVQARIREMVDETRKARIRIRIRQLVEQRARELIDRGTLPRDLVPALQKYQEQLTIEFQNNERTL